MSKVNLPEGFPEYASLRSLLFRTRAIIYKLRDKNLKKLGITNEQSGILWFVYNSNETIGPMQVSKAFHRKPNTISLAMKKMMEKDLIYYETDPKWKNRVIIKLTEKGRRSLEEYAKMDMEMMNVFEDLTKDEQKQLEDMLIKVSYRALEREKHTQTPRTLK